MKKILTASLLVLSALSLMSCASGGLPKFGADLGIQKTPLGDVRLPYTDVTSYYGYVAPGSTPDQVVGGKNMYYLYVWVPLVAPEVGIRMVSPSGKMVPTATDFVSPAFKTGSKDQASYFDTWITLERSAEVIMPADIAKAGSGSWINYGTNDDNSELPAQPSGSKYNSLMRVTSEVSNPLKALVRGLYRIGFTTYKVGDVKGTFLAQVGSPIKLPGVQITKTIEEMAKVAK